MIDRASLSCPDAQDLEMAKIGWHTEFAGPLKTEEGSMRLRQHRG
ncbi:MAG TPA: hypothetical protein VLA67_03815 [Nitrospiraceae bacterium]|nr:hypothetical protein [Nitrospiraceae bacterium]